MILRALPPVIDVSALQLLLVTVAAWLDRRKREMLAYLVDGMFSGTPMTREQRQVVTGPPIGIEPITLRALRTAVAVLTESFPAKEIDLMQRSGFVNTTTTGAAVNGREIFAVLRVRYLDEQKTWLYLDPHRGTMSKLEWIERRRAQLHDLVADVQASGAPRPPFWPDTPLVCQAPDHSSGCGLMPMPYHAFAEHSRWTGNLGPRVS